MRGATRRRSRTGIRITNFNPRTPCGVRRLDFLHPYGYNKHFNPRTPCGVRRKFRQIHSIHNTFQSTHPLRGATGIGKSRASISVFQSTHPLRGATLTSCYTLSVLSISIHAPLAGCDFRRFPRASAPANFNPRTPCGVRLERRIHPLRASGFQSTHPLRGATRRVKLLDLDQQFQSTHPLRGATSLYRSGMLHLLIFQSTHPLRGATTDVVRGYISKGISIHAPLAGCDPAASECFSMTS